MKRMMLKVLALVVLGCSMAFASKGPKKAVVVKRRTVTTKYGIPAPKRGGKKYSIFQYPTARPTGKKVEEKGEKVDENGKPEEAPVVVEEESEEEGGLLELAAPGDVDEDTSEEGASEEGEVEMLGAPGDDEDGGARMEDVD